MLMNSSVTSLIIRFLLEFKQESSSYRVNSFLSKNMLSSSSSKNKLYEDLFYVLYVEFWEYGEVPYLL